MVKNPARISFTGVLIRSFFWKCIFLEKTVLFLFSADIKKYNSYIILPVL